MRRKNVQGSGGRKDEDEDEGEGDGTSVQALDGVGLAGAGRAAVLPVCRAGRVRQGPCVSSSAGAACCKDPGWVQASLGKRPLPCVCRPHVPRHGADTTIAWRFMPERVVRRPPPRPARAPCPRRPHHRLRFRANDQGLGRLVRGTRKGQCRLPQANSGASFLAACSALPCLSRLVLCWSSYLYFSTLPHPWPYGAPSTVSSCAAPQLDLRLA